MHNSLKAVLGVLVMLMAAAPVAKPGTTSYICQIIRTASLIPDETSKWFADEAKKNTAAIDRKTGRVIHPVIGNTNFAAIEVIHAGSSQNSFKALAQTLPGRRGNFVRYYEVREFHEGFQKPFLAVVDSTVYFGTCR